MKVLKHLAQFINVFYVLHETFWNFNGTVIRHDYPDYNSKIWSLISKYV